VSHRTGEIIADVISAHTLDPDSPQDRPKCSPPCAAEPLDGHPQHVARMVQHAIASRSTPGLSDTKLKILAGHFSYGELQGLAASGVDAFDLLQKTAAQDISTRDRAASNGTGDRR